MCLRGSASPFFSSVPLDATWECIDSEDSGKIREGLYET
jgi:hypothetical protein